MSKGKTPSCKMPHEFSSEQVERIAQIECDVRDRLAHMPKRLAHSLSVAETAENLALVYGVDPYLARVAGLLHDWDKALTHDEIIEQARELGIDMGVDLALVQPLLHGIVAARELPERYPDLPASVFEAIDRHTTGAADMTPLDMVVFVADGIEPLRRGTIGIEETRSLVGKASLDDVYWSAFVGGIIYVVDGGRYLYPGTLDIYNELVLKRSEKKETA